MSFIVVNFAQVAPSPRTKTGAAIVPTTLLWVLAATILVLGIVHVLTYLCWYADTCGPARGFFMEFGYLFDMGAEMNVPTWFSTLQLAAVAALLVLAATVAEDGRWGWWMLVPLFLYLSFDEASDMHGHWIKAMGDSRIEGVAEGFNWIIPGAIVVVMVGLAFLPWLLRLPRRTCLLLVASGAVYVAGGLLLEALGAFLADENFSDPGYLLISSVEEMLEMFGISLMIFTVLDFLRGRRLEIQVAG